MAFAQQVLTAGGWVGVEAGATGDGADVRVAGAAQSAGQFWGFSGPSQRPSPQ